MQLYKLHVQQGRARQQREGVAVAGVPQEFDVTSKDLPMPPVARTTAGASRTKKRPDSRS
jgi:hypothetical protein